MATEDSIVDLTEVVIEFIDTLLNEWSDEVYENVMDNICEYASTAVASLKGYGNV